MGSALNSAPILSTPDNHILTEIEPIRIVEPSYDRSDEQFIVRYEISSTLREIRDNRWKRVALQFPDHMLSDSTRVYELLSRGLAVNSAPENGHSDTLQNLQTRTESLSIDREPKAAKLTILGDTSYGSCCVDEIAAEHVDAEAVVHYGRACLSPTARLPVLHVFTQMDLDHDTVMEAFQKTFPDLETSIIITADTPYASHVDSIYEMGNERGYTNLFAAAIIHDPSSLIPNRSVPSILKNDPDRLKDYHLFHISEPPTSLLLTLSSRMASVYIYPTLSSSSAISELANTSQLLRRRYALITSLSIVSTWGILINTLSVKNYLDVVGHVKKQIAESGKKAYLFVVGKLNAAKVANFAEIGGWVVIGCWESSLIDSRDFYKPIITPFELDLVLAGDHNRVWTGAWRSDFQGLLQKPPSYSCQDKEEQDPNDGSYESDEEPQDYREDSEEESAPPEFDLRTGTYVSHTRPMASSRSRTGKINANNNSSSTTSTAVTKRRNGEMVAINGFASPAAQFLAEKKTWKGLGSDFEIRYDDEEVEGDLVEEGRTGVAKGYSVGELKRT